jgi:hypothetical protein
MTVSQPTLFAGDAPVKADAVDAVPIEVEDVVTRARVCHPSGTPRRRVPMQVPEMTGSELRDAVKAFGHGDLVSLVVMLCSRVYPRIARDAVVAELAHRELVGPGEATGDAA